MYNFCPNCGANVPAGVRFCPNCGAQIAPDAANPQPQAPVYGAGGVPNNSQFNGPVNTPYGAPAYGQPSPPFGGPVYGQTNPPVNAPYNGPVYGQPSAPVGAPAAPPVSAPASAPERHKTVINYSFLLKDKLPEMKKRSHSKALRSRVWGIIFCVLAAAFVVAVIINPMGATPLLILAFGGLGAFFLVRSKKESDNEKTYDSASVSNVKIEIIKDRIDDIKFCHIPDDEGPDTYEVRLKTSRGKQVTYGESVYDRHIGNESEFIGGECYFIKLFDQEILDDIYVCSRYELSPELEQFCRN